MTAVCEDYYQLDLAWLRRRKMLKDYRVFLRRNPDRACLVSTDRPGDDGYAA